MNNQKISYLSFLSLLILACTVNTKKEKPLIIVEPAIEPLSMAKEIRDKIPAKIADGLKLSLWASDSLAPDPIAMSITDDGSVYLTRTNRQKNSEFDIRGHQNWMTPSIALQSVEDRRKFLRNTFATEKSAENTWLKDLNKDGVHDWKDLAVEKEEVWKLQDTNNDGLADKSTRVFNDLNEEITDIAGALMVREKDAFIGAGPDLWRLWDTNGDGYFDKKKSINHGFAVHIGFGGHGMSGLIEGPDGKIYWGIGDIGANLTTVDGKKFEYPNEGVIVRCNPDGTDFEVFASGLRNTHEFVFDQFGNIITEDNDGDHPTERERLMHVVEGLDAGWRANWQYGKYTDPKNNKYKVWMDEKMSVPHWKGQAAYFLPPLMNYHNGPTGMQYNPGTALGKAYQNKFFIVEFVGTPTGSHVWSFGLKPNGATFEFDGEKDILNGVLPTAIKFGPDGALYVADWINGWNTKNYGRVWKIDVTEDNNDLADLRKKTQAYLNLKYELQTELMLKDLLSYEDMRVRQKAQFELAKRGKKGLEIFKSVLNSENQLARIHSIWGIRQLSRNVPGNAELLLPLLKHRDYETIAQAAKTLGDLKFDNATDILIGLLSHQNSRVKFYAAEALGRIGNIKAIDPIFEMIEQNNDQDLYLRHAGIFALYRLKAEDQAASLSTNSSNALKTAAVVILRKLRSDKIALFLEDKDEYIVAEAARGINDDLSIPGAFDALVKVLNNTDISSEVIIRRAINVASRLGDDASLEILINYSKRPGISDAMRAEAIATLGLWAEPSVLDRVDGRYRGIVKRDLSKVKTMVQPHISTYLNDQNPATVAAVAQLLANLGITDFNDLLAEKFYLASDSKLKATITESLAHLNFKNLKELVTSGLSDKKTDVRAAAIGALNKIEINESELSDIVKPIFESGLTREKQRLVGILGTLPISKTEKVLGSLVEMLKNGKLDKELILDLSESIEKSGSENLKNQIAQLTKTDNWIDEFKASLFGGNYWEGRNIFENNSAAQCVRCHTTSAGQAATVGPNLNKIGSKLDRQTLLEALVKPSNRLAPGFGSVILTLKDGQEIIGTLASETDTELTITTSDAEPTKVAKSRIERRENIPSSMPPMGDILSKRELRDLVEYLASLK